MGKIVSIIGGTAAIVVGIMLIFLWNEAFVLGLQFLAMIILAMGGLIAVIAGVSEIKDSLAAKKEESKEECKKEEEKK
ncbi:MAG: hypothetical protein ABH843_02120 [Candidatus Omnitrophota bacterium]